MAFFAFDRWQTSAGLPGLLGALVARLTGPRNGPPSSAARDARQSGLILDAINDAVLVIDADGRILDLNARACEFYGLTRAELVGRPVIELRAEAERQGQPEMMARIVEAGCLRYETVHVTAGGQTVPVEVNSRVAVLGDRRVLVGVVRDVSTHKAAEARILRLNRTLRTLSEINQVIAREEDPDRLLVRICEVAITCGGFRMAWLGRAEPDGRVQALASAGDHDGYLRSVAIRWDDTPEGRGPTGTAIREGRTVAVDQIETESGFEPWRDAAVRSGFRSSIATPVRIRGEQFGALSLCAAEPQAMDREVLELVEELASDIGLALQAFEDRRRLRESEEKLRAFFDGGLIGILFGDVHGNILDANDALLRLVGYSREDLRAGRLRWTDITPPEYLPLDTARIAEAQARGACTPYEKEYIRKDGSRVWVLVGYVLFGERRELSAAFILDITEQRRAEAERDALLERLRLQFERLPIPFLLTSPDLTILEWNPAAERVFGFTREEAVGRSPFGLITPESLRPRLQPFMAALAEGDRTIDLVNENVTKDGRAIECQWHDTPLRGADGALIGFMAMAQDVTERRLADAQLDAARRELAQAQRMEAVGRLAGGIAHDFNNLLTAVLGYAAFLLERHPPGDPEHEDIEEIRRAGERAARLTEQLLAFSRRQILQPKVLDLNETVAGLARLLGRVIGEDIDIVTRQAGELGRVVADPGRLDQVLMNLAVNARDAMPQGGRLTIETRNVDITTDDDAAISSEIAPGAYVCLSVGDTGAGMSPQVRAQIFEPFFTTKALGKGAGLGLSTVYGIVKQSGGYIEVESAEGAGTTFRIYLPRTPKAATPETSASRARPAAGPLPGI